MPHLWVLHNVQVSAAASCSCLAISMGHCAAPHLHHHPLAPFTYDHACHMTNFGGWAVYGLRKGVKADAGQLAWDGKSLFICTCEGSRMCCTYRRQCATAERHPATSSSLRCMRSGLWPCVNKALCFAGKFDWEKPHTSHLHMHIRWLSLLLGSCHMELRTCAAMFAATTTCMRWSQWAKVPPIPHLSCCRCAH